MDRAIVGVGAIIRRSIIGRQVTINSTLQKSRRVENLSVIADNVTLSSGCHLSEGKVYPHLTPPEGRFVKQTIHSIIVTD
jgi:NDP-sugar pyrophosphorylase family protein